ncbi:hypothetical protein TW65_03919 [Stemphylium lycopersici]|uniref:Uncharacterized protein n=1 Tax=Stemphylium lycopersici TaxID=183478 RepID=A0A364N0A4_STELY|nr:hypothetical protein TW65_03919 [Stemphylium lycopersici]RAR08198.1 hypothetical protein DDE83_006115 [Stemphylium lycopersici]
MIPIITLTGPEQVNEEYSVIETDDELPKSEANEEGSVIEPDEEISVSETDEDISVIETAEEISLGIFDVCRAIREDIYSLITEVKKPSMVPVDHNDTLETTSSLLDETRKVYGDLDEQYPEEQQSLWAKDQLAQLGKARLALNIGVKWRVQDTENRGVMGDSSQLD